MLWQKQPHKPFDLLELTMILHLQPHFYDSQTPVVLHNHSAGDAFYELLMNAHRDLSEPASNALNARLILLLANHIGDLAVLKQALAIAQES